MSKRNSFWKNKKVFITGHTGFKGSWLSITLKMMGAHVTGYSLKPPTNPSLFKLANLEKYIDKSIISDICNFKNLKKSLQKCNPEIVFHLAAQSLVIESYKDPKKNYLVNSIGTLNVLENLRFLKRLKCGIIVTTDKVYKTSNNKKKFSEEDDLGVTDPYGSSKVCAEIISESYNKSFFSKSKSLKIATVRAGNVIGGGDFSENRILPDFFRGLKKGNKIVLRNPEHIRPWQYILEPISGYLQLAEKISKKKFKSNHESWNFAPKSKNCVSVKKLILLLNKFSSNRIKIYYKKNSKKIKETSYLSLDNTKAKKTINWKPKYSLYETLQKIWEWYDATKKNRNYKNITKKHIYEYFKKNYKIEEI